MTKVVVLKDDAPYAEDYEAWLLGWVTHEGNVMALVAQEDGDPVWMVHLTRIRLWSQEV